jgi:nucleotide-binding universal stress UspA family protein
MMTKILFPTDFSETANNAFLYAVQLAKKMNADIKIISVQSNLKNYLNTTEEDFKNHINQLKETAIHNNLINVNIESDIVIGDLLLTILDIIEKENIEFVVMGTNGENSFGKKLFGSNTVNVINNSPIPVFAIPNNIQFKEESNLAYATLFNNDENTALQEMTQIADLFAKKLNIVHVENELMTNEMVETRNNWQLQYPNLTITMEKSEDVETGLLNFTTQKEIDVLGVYHRDSSFFDRLFSENHSSNLINLGNVALVVF